MTEPANTSASDPSEEPTAEEMNAFNDFSELDVPSPISVVGEPRIVSEPVLSSFSPDHQTEILQRAGSARPEAITAAITSFLLDKRRELLIRGGAGEGATETQKTMLEQANRVRVLKADIARIDEHLEDVLGHRTEVDATGKATPVPVYRLQGSSRTAYEAERDRLVHEMALIAGIEGDRELREANRRDALNARETRARVEEHQEITRRAHEIAREARITTAAERRAKFLNRN